MSFYQKMLLVKNSSFIIKKILIWICLWLTIAGGSIYLLKFVGADQFHHFYITTGYFYLFALLGIFSYKIENKFEHHAALSHQISINLLYALCLSIFCLFIDRMIPLNNMNLAKIMHDGFYFPLFRYETLITKVADITFQQVFIFSLISELKKLNLENKKIILYFSAAFFIVHLPLVLAMGTVAFYFIIPSFFAGAVFSYLILNNRYGLSLSFMVHFSFYFLIGLYLRY